MFKNAYSKNSNGLFSFVDPEDNEHYIYSCFEPFYANHMFPCFDQPDLKAPLQLSTITPEKWVVISNEHEEQFDRGKESIRAKLNSLRVPEYLLRELRDSYVLRVFKQTPEISTYLYGVTAGMYKEYKPAVDEAGFPPMRLFARQSMNKYVAKMSEEIFKYTKDGIAFFREFFNSPFPFRKYDQIFVPEFKYNGMENVGAVIYKEDYLAKEIMTKIDKQMLAEILLHQVSHMWYGNLVTMKWWNDLWLNESFAVFMAYLALDKAKGFEQYHLSAWTMFHKNLSTAYIEDQTSSNHPIATPVNTTEDAETIFDSITYWKGASVLKQLYCYLGEDVFRSGIQEYFIKFKSKNTELRDFIQCMKLGLVNHKKEADLDAWVDLWLKKKGVNELTPEIEIENGVIKKFTVHQTWAKNGEKVCRMHKMDIALYADSWAEEIYPLTLIEPQPTCTVPSLVGLPKPHAVLLNVHDNTYAKIYLDPGSRKPFFTHLCFIDDVLTKLVIWKSIWDMLRESMISIREFMQLVVSQLSSENEVLILTLSLDYALKVISEYIPNDFKTKEASAIFEEIIKKVGKDKGVEHKRHLIKYAIELAYTKEQRGLLLHWAMEKEDIGFKLSQENKYAIIKLIFRSQDISMEEKTAILEAEVSKDKSIQGIKARLACRASLPDPKIKEELWNWYIKEDHSESEQNILASMSAFWCWEQSELLEKSAQMFFNDVSLYYLTK